MSRWLRLPGAAVGILLLAASTRPTGSEVVPASIDVHVHLWGANAPAWGRGGGPRAARRPPFGGPRRLQEETPEAFEPAVAALLAEMDRHGVAKAIILAPPSTEEANIPSRYPALREVVRRHADRLVLGGGGGTLSCLLASTPPDRVTETVRREFRSQAEAHIADGVHVFGELTALHLSFHPRHPFIEVPPDHPLFLLLAEISGRSGVPIDLHMEAVPEEMPLPQGFGSLNPPRLRANIPALERLLAHDRAAKIVWQPIGWDNTGGMTVGLLRRLLAAHPNLYLALRVEERVLRMDGRTPMPNRIVDAEGAIRSEWRALLAEFPDRFVIGSDEFFGPPGTRSPQSFEETWRILARLPPDLARKIGRANAARIYRLEE